MGRHVNHQDEQDRLINKNSKIARNNKTSLEDRDPGSLSIKEQEELMAAKKKLVIKTEIKIEKPRFTGKK